MNDDKILMNVRRVIKEMMTVGTGGLTSTSSPEGPVAGYDKPLKKKVKKVSDVVKR